MPAAAKAVADFNAKRQVGENLQTEDANCVPPGMPRMMQMPYPIEFLFTPGRVTVITEAYMQCGASTPTGASRPTIPIRSSTATASAIGKVTRWSSRPTASSPRRH